MLCTQRTYEVVESYELNWHQCQERMPELIGLNREVEVENRKWQMGLGGEAECQLWYLIEIFDISQMIEKPYFTSTTSHGEVPGVYFVSINHFRDHLLRLLNSFINLFIFLITTFVFPWSWGYLDLSPKLNHLQMCITTIRIIAIACSFYLEFLA